MCAFERSEKGMKFYMKVIYNNGKEEIVEKEIEEKLYIKGRLTLEAWKELLATMNELDILKFEDSFVKQFGEEFITKNYVENQVKHLSFQ